MTQRQPLALVRATSVILRGVYRLFGGFTVSGLEHVPESGGAILAGNHLSWGDPPAIRAVIRRRLWFMANEFLFRVPVLGKLIPLYGAFPVDRDRMDRESLRRAERHLQDGDLLCIFPEGGTTLTGRLSPFEGGAALLAIRNNVPIVPMAITGTDRVWPMGGENPALPRYARGGVTVRFGPPIHPESIDGSLSRKQRLELLTQKTYEGVAALLPPEYLPEEPVALRSEVARV
ncbi:MAG: lysophospholipid acyltransferase family protein [Armatimonadota bacterium]